jgi:hypothetical protein
MVRKGEVAWLSAEEMRAAAEPLPNAYPPPEDGEQNSMLLEMDKHHAFY